MQTARAMAESIKPVLREDEPGAPIAKDAIDPDLIKLKRARTKIGIVTAAGLVFLCGLFLVRLSPDRRFAGSDAIPERVQVADVLAGKVALDRYVKLEGAEPMISHAIRATVSKGNLGVRVAPVRGTGDRLWLAVSGDGWEQPSGGAYSGRLRKLADLPFAAAVTSYSAEHLRPVFATADAIRAGFATNNVQSVSGDPISIADSDKIGFDVIDPDTSVVIGTLGDKFPSARAWAMALVSAGVPVDGTPETTQQTVRYTVLASAATIAPKLEKANLWAARVEPVTKHLETTWSVLRSASQGAAGLAFVVSGQTIPAAQVDLVGVYVARAVPADAYALLAEERPGDYWYVLPITIVLAAIGLLFAWALVRAVKRDLLPTRA
jgi:hypothetical protein